MKEPAFPTPGIAGVCLLDNPFPIDGEYDYRIPEELLGEVFPGRFVSVPFGTANHKRQALVMRLKETSDYKDLKPIFSVLSPNLSLDREMLGLCAFMKQRTLCSTGDAIRSIIPAAALSRLVSYFSIREEQVLSGPEELSEGDYALYSYLQTRGETSADALREAFGPGVEARWKRLVAKGYLLHKELFKDAGEGLTQKTYCLAVSPDETGGLKLTSKQQKEVVSVLLDIGAPLPMAELCRLADVTEAPVKTLVSRGILIELANKIERNPYADLPYLGRKEISLNDEQEEAYQTLRSLAFSGEPKAALLFGVTGSGKTAVMERLIDDLIDADKGVILLLPEISLTPQTLSIFCARYGDKVAVIHSALSQGERYDAYRKIREGRAKLVVGTRSAVFSPVQNLGAILIDEEQEHTYKSDQSPRYHARDIARYRCGQNKSLMLLASATPSIESFHKAKQGTYTLLRLTRRYGDAALPRVEVVDMRREVQSGNLSLLGRRLLDELAARKAAHEQSILFLNRRGYHRFVSCRSCGEALVCPNCSVSMTYHTSPGRYDAGQMICHFCGHREPLPKACPKCASPHLAPFGFGIQKVEEELGTAFPEEKLLRMDTDTTATKFAYDKLLGAFRNHEADILLGTQMVTKGHDFPDVTLVGVLSADSSLYLDDFRASERTFSMLTQVVGRAGRRDQTGLAVIQTMNPDHEVIRLAEKQDYEGFYEREIRLRRLLVFPPFCDIALLTLTGGDEGRLLRCATLLHDELKGLGAEFPEVQFVAFGPFEAPVYRVENKYRMRMVLKCRLARPTYEFFGTLVCHFTEKAGRLATLSVDFNPSTL